MIEPYPIDNETAWRIFVDSIAIDFHGMDAEKMAKRVAMLLNKDEKEKP